MKAKIILQQLWALKMGRSGPYVYSLGMDIDVKRINACKKHKNSALDKFLPTRQGDRTAWIL
jgi:hypothetical protein